MAAPVRTGLRNPLWVEDGSRDSRLRRADELMPNNSVAPGAMLAGRAEDCSSRRICGKIGADGSTIDSIVARGTIARHAAKFQATASPATLLMNGSFAAICLRVA